MKTVLIIVLIIYGLLVSCYKPYDPNIVANDNILVVEGMITNEVASYHINLSYALPFDSKGTGKPVTSASVYVTDNLGNNYPFRDSRNGHYISDSLQFTGNPGSVYILNIETPDGEIYRSGPQRLYPEYPLDTVYAVVEYQETISRFNEVYSTVRGTNILVNIESDSDTLPHFRFTSNLLRLYNYVVSRGRVDYMLYCWETDNTIMDINLTQKEYTNDFFLVSQHAVYFTDDKISFYLTEYELDTLPPYNLFIPSKSELHPIAHRILYLDQYSLNNETYQYYKGMDEQLRSEGKLFDPIAVQLSGNIKCITNPEKKPFGFFEASSVSCTSYRIGFRRYNDQYSVTQIPYVFPYIPNGCWVNKTPPFWIQY